jgi:arsenate reductase (thioredoxin)
MSLPSVLFLCTGNSARSQMAEAFMKKYASDTFIADSAGIEPKGIHPLTIQVMQEVGIDMSGHRSKDLREFMGRKHSSHIITVSGHADQNCPRGLWSTGQKIH